jgi:hypothetical protein
VATGAVVVEVEEEVGSVCPLEIPRLVSPSRENMCVMLVLRLLFPGFDMFDMGTATDSISQLCRETFCTSKIPKARSHRTTKVH